MESAESPPARKSDSPKQRYGISKRLKIAAVSDTDNESCEPSIDMTDAKHILGHWIEV